MSQLPGNALIEAAKKSHPLEFAMVEALEPMVSELVQLEKAHDKTVARLAEFEERIGMTIEAAKSGASEEARAVIDEAVSPLKADLRETFSQAIKEVKSITEEALATANRNAAVVAKSIDERREMAVAILMAEAYRYGA